MPRMDAARSDSGSRKPRPAAAFMLSFLAPAALAADLATTPVEPAEESRFESIAPFAEPLPATDAWDPALAAALLPDPDFEPASPAAAAPAQELATGLGIQVEKKRRRFRQRAVNWMSDYSTSAGFLADFLIGGADSGWHLVVDPTGTDEYILEWKAKFR